MWHCFDSHFRIAIAKRNSTTEKDSFISAPAVKQAEWLTSTGEAFINDCDKSCANDSFRLRHQTSDITLNFCFVIFNSVIRWLCFCALWVLSITSPTLLTSTHGVTCGQVIRDWVRGLGGGFALSDLLSSSSLQVERWRGGATLRPSETLPVVPWGGGVRRRTAQDSARPPWQHQQQWGWVAGDRGVWHH